LQSPQKHTATVGNQTTTTPYKPRSSYKDAMTLVSKSRQDYFRNRKNTVVPTSNDRFGPKPVIHTSNSRERFLSSVKKDISRLGLGNTSSNIINRRGSTSNAFGGVNYAINANNMSVISKIS
jgi:hypothetical protein